MSCREGKRGVPSSPVRYPARPVLCLGRSTEAPLPTPVPDVTVGAVGGARVAAAGRSGEARGADGALSSSLQHPAGTPFLAPPVRRAGMGATESGGPSSRGPCTLGSGYSWDSLRHSYHDAATVLGSASEAGAGTQSRRPDAGVCTLGQRAAPGSSFPSGSPALALSRRLFAGWLDPGPGARRPHSVPQTSRRETLRDMPGRTGSCGSQRGSRYPPGVIPSEEDHNARRRWVSGADKLCHRPPRRPHVGAAERNP